MMFDRIFFILLVIPVFFIFYLTPKSEIDIIRHNTVQAPEETDHEFECVIPEENKDDLIFWSKQAESPLYGSGCPFLRLSHADITGRLHIDPRCENPKISLERGGQKRNFTDDESIIGKEIQNIHCTNNGISFATEHFGFSMKKYYSVAMKHREDKYLEPVIPLNVYLIISDSTSAAHFRRSCPQSIQYLNELPNAEAFEFTKFNILGGHHTSQNALPLYFGHDCGGPEPRFNTHFYNSVGFDNNITKTHFLPAYFKKFGYFTTSLDHQCLQHPVYGANAFSPIFYYPYSSNCAVLLKKFYGDRTYELIDIPQPRSLSCLWEDRNPNIKSSAQCDYPDTATEYISNMIYQLPKENLYFHMAHLQIGHRSILPFLLSTFDQPLLQLLKSVDFNNSMFIFVGDHGLHFGTFLTTKQGQLEHELPVLHITMPNWVLEKYPEMRKNLRENQKKLVNVWDVHHTLKQLSIYPEHPKELIPPPTYSLFGKIPDRTCETAGIETAFCACNQWVKYDRRNELLKHIDKSLNEKVNSHIMKESNCSKIIGYTIKSVDAEVTKGGERKRNFRIIIQHRKVLLEIILYREILDNNMEISSVISLKRINSLTKTEKEEARKTGIELDLCIT
jgi:Protein of unknown function (DUF229)